MAVSPLEPPYTPEQNQLLQKWMPPNSPFDPLLLFRILASHPDMTEAILPTGRFFLGRQKDISVRQREIVILRTCALRSCEYEWGVHVTGFAVAAGLTEQQIKDTCAPEPSTGLWQEDELALINACTSLVREHHLSERDKRALHDHFSEQSILSVITLCGWYSTISLIANSCCSHNEPWAAKFPDKT